MRQILAAMLVIAGVTATTNANAQIGRLLGKAVGMPASGEAGGTYQSKNQIRTFISSGPHEDIDLYGKIIVKAGEMTRDKGFSRFGVTKRSCSTMLVNNVPSAKGCYVIAVMLNDGEEAQPRGDRKVQYYQVSEVLSGVIAPPDGQ